jgi:hypothetical protein
MPNRRHPSKRFIGLWGTVQVHRQLQEIAKKQKTTVSMLIWRILLDFVSHN